MSSSDPKQPTPTPASPTPTIRKGSEPVSPMVKTFDYASAVKTGLIPQQTPSRSEQALGYGRPSLTPSMPMSSSVSSASEISSDEEVPRSARSTTYSQGQSQAQTPYERTPASTGYQGSTLKQAPRVRSQMPGGTMSRSASRARVPQRDQDDEEDDEVPVRDRGEDLIRRRMIERKKAKKRASKRAERGETWEQAQGGEQTPMGERGDPFMSMPSTPAAGPQQYGMVSARNVSRSRGPSVERHGSYGTGSGYFSQAHGSHPTDSTLSPTESMRYVETEDERNERKRGVKAPSLLDEVVQEVVEEDARSHRAEEDEDEDEDEDDDDDGESPDEVTLRDRQDAINIEHPFGLPIWKPALYKKSRSVTRNADNALHSIPSAAAERHLLPGNLLWVVLFGWWLAIICYIIAVVVGAVEALAAGGGYGQLLRGLAWYIGWPFGKYVEGEGAPEEDEDGDDDATSVRVASESSGHTVRERVTTDIREDDERGRDLERQDTIRVATTPTPTGREVSVSFAPVPKGKARENHYGSIGNGTGVRKPDGGDERTALLGKRRCKRPTKASKIGRFIYWPLFLGIIAPLMLLVCVLCWGLVITIPMARLTWALLTHLTLRPLQIDFRRAPKIPVANPPSDASGTASSGEESPPGFTMKRARLKAGQLAPTSGPDSTVRLCTYRATGSQYYKYTVGGVNIMFINLLPMVFFTIIDAFIILPAVNKAHHRGHHVDPFISFVASQAFIFFLGLASVIPLSYFIGMAVASISAQSSIGMGAVINATFGSVIEIVLYSIALTQGKGRLVEGSIVGSILAGVLFMPGISMCSGALKRKEQKFNAKSAGVTSTMLIMAIIGTLTPTLFYQTYGSFELHCEGCPDNLFSLASTSLTTMSQSWKCDNCRYVHPEPTSDPFYQESVKTLMYSCAAILLLSYLIGLWFSLRTHASQIWQNPQQVMKIDEPPTGAMHPALRASLHQRLTPQAFLQQGLPQHRPAGQGPEESPPKTAHPRSVSQHREPPATAHPSGYTPFIDTINRDLKAESCTPMRLPSSLTTEDFTRAVAAATVSALRHQNAALPAKPRPASGEVEEDSHGGHEGPSWSRGMSATVLLSCTLLYAIIAEVLVDVVDVVLNGSGIDEKFLGLTLFALVPNTTEFMNAMSFALNGNIALSMEIGSAYALQVCLLQIPAMVAFSAYFAPERSGDAMDTFTLIFPRWDAIAIILSIFLLTYTYIEARSNYHRGSILILAYIVLTMGFYFAPPNVAGDTRPDEIWPSGTYDSSNSFKQTLSLLWAR